MKKIIGFALAASLAIVLSFSGKVQAQNGQGCAMGQAHQLLNTCVNGYRPGYDITFSNSPNEFGGYTVTVYAAPKCPQGQICPLYIFFLGSVATDANCDVVSVSSVCR